MQTEANNQDISVVPETPSTISETTHLLANPQQEYGVTNNNDAGIITESALIAVATNILPAEEMDKFKRFVYGYLQPTTLLFINTVVFGGSCKAWLDPIMKTLMFDIDEIIPADWDWTFNTEATSKFGAYVALIMIIAGYFINLYMMSHPNINNKHTYRLNMLTQYVGALGLSGYIYTGSNYGATVACSSLYKSGHVSLCSKEILAHPPMPLSTFCCVNPK